MKRTLVPVLAAALILAFTLSVLADDLASSPKQIKCTIMNVDTASNTVTVADVQAKETTYNVDQATMITIGGEKVTLADLKVGQAVKLKVNGNKALSIEA
jgi:ABC-type proline/glycine betaine transport system substrate-binding protein